jgi:hypothetical protein
MGNIRFSVSLCLSATLASAQAAPPAERGGVYPSDPGAQRRVEIREVTMQGRGGGVGVPLAGGTSVMPASPSPPYQLSPQGRAELREQLRRERYERNEKRGDRP